MRKYNFIEYNYLYKYRSNYRKKTYIINMEKLL